MSRPVASELVGGVSGGSRLAEVRRLLGELEERAGAGSEGEFEAVAMLLADAALAGDEGSLVAAQQGLQRVYGRQLRVERPAAEELELRGRVLALLDVLQWALRRLTPASALARLEPSSHARAFLDAIVAEPGLSNQQLAARLRTDETEVSRVGRRLLEAGMARKRKLGRRNHWQITPRGDQALRLDSENGRHGNGALHGDRRREALRLIARLVLEHADFGYDEDNPSKSLPVPSRVLAMLIAADGPLSPREIAKKTDLSEQVVATAVGFLMTHGYVRREGQEETPENGLPDADQPLRVSYEDYCALGVTILTDRLVGVVTDLRARTRRVRERALPIGSSSRLPTPERVVDEVAKLVSELRDPEPREGEAPLPPHTIGLGVEIGGHVQEKSGTVVVSPNFEWARPVPLAELLRDATGLVTVVENDANALAIHERLFGSDPGLDWSAAILVDNGVGCGLILDGRLAHGASGLAGEIGHIVVDPGGRACRCGNVGCLEGVASVPAILEAIREARGTEAPQTLEEAVELVADRDEHAEAAIREAGAALGRAVSVLQNLVNPGPILISLPEVLNEDNRAAGIFQSELNEAVEAHVFSVPPDVRLAHLPRGAEFGARGAASTVLHRFIRRPLNWRPVPTAVSVAAPVLTEQEAPASPLDDRAALEALTTAFSRFAGDVGESSVSDDAADSEDAAQLMTLIGV
jgi:predicted NBD/HSP70 family sugar kinase/predicted transcriptional regulator